MKLHDLPRAPINDAPIYARFDKDKQKVIWSSIPQDGGDGECWFDVVRDGRAVTLTALQWYSSDGKFVMTISHLEADEAVRIADMVADETNKLA